MSRPALPTSCTAIIQNTADEAQRLRHCLQESTVELHETTMSDVLSAFKHVQDRSSFVGSSKGERTFEADPSRAYLRFSSWQNEWNGTRYRSIQFEQQESGNIVVRRKEWTDDASAPKWTASAEFAIEEGTMTFVSASDSQNTPKTPDDGIAILTAAIFQLGQLLSQQLDASRSLEVREGMVRSMVFLNGLQHAVMMASRVAAEYGDALSCPNGYSMQCSCEPTP